MLTCKVLARIFCIAFSFSLTMLSIPVLGQEPKIPHQNNVVKISNENQPSVSVAYPTFGKRHIDKDIRFFIENQVANFLQIANENLKAEEDPKAAARFEMDGNYSLSQPNENIVSVVFRIGSYSGGAHGNYISAVLNFDLQTDRQLYFQDLFEKPMEAVKILSKFCSAALKIKLGENADKDMITDGTLPTLGNFSEIQLLPEKLIVHFQPYQVGPWSEGAPEIEVPLKILAPAMLERNIFATP